MTDGLAGFVANALSGGQTAFLRDLDELCNRHALYETAVAAVADAPRLRRYAGDFPDVERHIAMPSLGHGPERVLYQLNPGLLCQSPLFEHFHVADMPQLLSALDALAAENPERDLLIDRHIAAFCACRWADSSGLVVDLARNDRRYPERAVFTLRLYALAQEAFGIPSLPSLARHFAAKLTPAVRQLHHGRTKDAMMRRLDRLAAGGSLPRFHDELNFIAVRDRDRERFTAARATVAVIDRHLASIRRGFNPADAEAQSLGQRIAMGAGWLALLLSLSFTVLHGV
jgi:hypothetical protein